MVDVPILPCLSTVMIVNNIYPLGWANTRLETGSDMKPMLELTAYLCNLTELYVERRKL
jgi:hypothetical protein